MDFKIIEYKSSEYDRMVNLRYRILREPLQLTFSENDLAKDKDDILLGAFFDNSEQIVGYCILTHLNENTVQLRQMAIDTFYQGKGLGNDLLSYAEQVSLKKKYRYIYLHARKVAVSFYKKNGYTTEGDQFTEVGIPHFEMLKHIEE